MRARSLLARCRLHERLGRSVAWHRWRPQQRRLTFGFGLAGRTLAEFRAQRVEPFGCQVGEGLVAVLDISQRLLMRGISGLCINQFGHAQTLQQCLVRGLLLCFVASEFCQVGPAWNDLKPTDARDVEFGCRRDELLSGARQALPRQGDIGGASNIEANARGRSLLPDAKFVELGVLIAQARDVGFLQL